MGDEEDRREVRKCLEAAGLRVEDIPEDSVAGSKRCDVFARDASERYLVEVKGFHDDEMIKGKLHNAEVYERDSSDTYRGNVTKEIRDAIKQLGSTALHYDDAIWLVALVARSKHDADVMSEQIMGTLYGVAAITDRGPDGVARRRHCLYFSESAFHRHPDLDGAIVLDAQGVGLYLNDYGRRVNRVRESGLARFLAQHSASYDMAELESRADCLVADFDMDRANREAVLDRLKQKYAGRNLSYMDWHRWEAIGRWP